VGLSPVGTLTLFAVVSVLVLVSLPRLHGFARRENERDALQAVRVLSQEIAARAPGIALPALEELVDSQELSRALTDAEFLDEGRLMRRHGYLFRVARARSPRERPVLLAWPWEARRTGSTVVACTAGGGIWLHPNQEGRWSGLERPPVVPVQALEQPGSSWRPVP
jgi:hypothetical protein